MQFLILHDAQFSQCNDSSNRGFVFVIAFSFFRRGQWNHVMIVELKRKMIDLRSSALISSSTLLFRSIVARRARRYSLFYFFFYFRVMHFAIVELFHLFIFNVELNYFASARAFMRTINFTLPRKKLKWIIFRLHFFPRHIMKILLSVSSARRS